MFGSISLSDPSSYQFHKGSCSDRLQKPLETTYRPESLENENFQVHLLGSLIGFHRSGRLIKAGLPQVMEHYRSVSEEDFVSSLEGLYLLYVYDKKKNVHFIINNRYQLTKLYYRLDSTKLEFASDLKTLIREANSVQPHFPSINNFLSNGFNVSDQTQIQGIKKLLPCFWLRVSTDGVEVNNFWSEQIDFNRQPFENIESHLDLYEETYRKTLRNYLEVRQPQELATLLSGGHDTSFVMLQGSQVFEKPIHGFTTVFPTWKFSEESYAENICNKFGGRFHRVPFESHHVDSIADLISATEEPVLGSSLPLHVLAEEASEYTDTMLGGDGGDTLWGEYHPVAEFHRWVQSMPMFMRSGIHSTSKILRKLTDWERFWELEHVAGLFTKPDYYTNFMTNLCTYRHFTSKYLSELMVPEVYDFGKQESLLNIPFRKDNFSEALIESKLFNAFYTYQSFQQTRSMNSFGMEFYLPTINSEVIQFITQLPNDWVNGGSTFHRLSNSKRYNRKFHKRALSRYLRKDEIYNRSFDIPWFQIIKPRKHLLDLLLRRLLKRGWYQAEPLKKLFFEFAQQKDKGSELLELKSHGYRILALLSLEIWALQFIDGHPPEKGIQLEEYLQ